jgi:hypothetical protein
MRARHPPCLVIGLLVLIVGSLADRLGATCDNLCRVRQTFYICPNGGCLSLAYPDCSFCSSGPGFACKDLNDGHSVNCIKATTNTPVLLTWGTCDPDPACDCTNMQYVQGWAFASTTGTDSVDRFICDWNPP